MHNFKIISDSACDLPKEIKEKYDIQLAPFSVTFDTVHYAKENIDITPHEFYIQIMNNSQYPKTSLPSIQDYMDIAEEILKQGQDILCFSLSSKFSGSYQSAQNARNILLEAYPERQMIVIDSIQATGGQGLVVYEAARMRDAGLSIQETKEKIEMLKQTAKINFTLDSLDYLQKGGRIGKADALAGTILNIKPIIVVENGELIPYAKVRGLKKALRTIVDKTTAEIGENKEQYQICLIKASRDDDISFVKEILESEYGFTIMEPMFDIGVTICAHTGHTPFGICYVKKYEYI